MYCLKVCHNQSPDGWTLAAVCRCSEGPNAPDAALWHHQRIAWTRERKSMRLDILRDEESEKMKAMWKPQALWSILRKTLFDGLLTKCSFSASSGKLICVVKLTEICLCVSHMLTELLDVCIKAQILQWIKFTTKAKHLKNYCLWMQHIQRMLQGIANPNTTILSSFIHPHLRDLKYRA